MTKFERGSAKKQAVPKRDEKPIHGLVSDKNFIVANAVENILAGKYHFIIFLLRRASWLLSLIGKGVVLAVTLFRFEFEKSARLPYHLLSLL